MPCVRWLVDRAHVRYRRDLTGFPSFPLAAVVVLGADRLQWRAIVKSWRLFDTFALEEHCVGESLGRQKDIGERSAGITCRWIILPKT